MPKKSNNKEKLTLEEMRAKVKKELGKDFYSDPNNSKDVLSTGYHSIDDLLNGGLRTGTYVEFFGENSVGKTTLAYHLMAEAQKQFDKPVCYIDLEQSWIGDRARSLGIDFAEDKLEVVRPTYQEAVYEYLYEALKNDIFSIIVVDSISGMVPEVETRTEFEKASFGMQGAKNNAKGLRLLTSVIDSTIVIFINQIRDNTDAGLFGPKITTAGGKALLHFYHLRLQFTKLAVEAEEVPVYSPKTNNMETQKIKPGHIIRLKIAKSKIDGAVPEHICDVVYSQAEKDISRLEDLKQMLYRTDNLKKVGNFYELHGVDKKLKKKEVDEYILENFEELEKVIGGENE